MVGPLVNNELVGTWKEVIMTQSEVVLQLLPGQTEGSHKNIVRVASISTKI
jgi:hypothetical protein